MTESTLTAIRAVLDATAQAIRAKDADGVASRHAETSVRFDLAPPLAEAGIAALRNDLNAWFATWRGAIRYEHRDMAITTDGDIAFAHGLVRIGGTKLDGSSPEIWARQTVCLSRQADGWKIVHEHTSTPFYMDGSLRAAVDLSP